MIIMLNEEKNQLELNNIESANKEYSIDAVIKEKVKETDNVKEAIDLMTTTTALKQEGVLDKLVGEKERELIENAETKKLQAETDKLKKEKEKEIAEYDKIITAKKNEIEQLKVEADKSNTFFNNNKDILKYIGVREQKSLKTMQFLMFPATITFIIVQLLLFPFTFIGLLIETVINIIGGICEAISNNALKIIIAILVILLLFGGGFCIYYFGGKALI